MNTSTRGFSTIQGVVGVAVLALGAILAMYGCSDKATPTTAKGAADSDGGAKIARAKEDLRSLSEIVANAQAKSQGTLGKITKHPCSDCVCRAGADLRNVPETHACMAAWTRIMASLEALQNPPGKGDRLKRDPWGSPFAVDENQGEVNAAGCKNPDRLRSVGADGKWGTSDDIIIDLPLSPVCP